MVKYDSKALRVDADIFLNMEEKISVYGHVGTRPQFNSTMQRFRPAT